VADIEPLRVCNTCNELKTFHPSRASYCKDCSRLRNLAWRTANPEFEKNRAKRRHQDPKNKARVSKYRKKKRRTSSAFRENEVAKNHAQKLKKYGLTSAQYLAMLTAQAERCAICGEPETRVRMERKTKLNVDHDHSTGKVRALLCNQCNTGLGCFKDSPCKLRLALAYLLEHGKSDDD